MTPEQWRRVRDLFEQAVELPPFDADPWLARQDEPAAVLDEVRSLLAHHSRAGGFLDTPAGERMSAWLETDDRFEPGAVIGAYAIRRELGRGGMGRVYLATDSRLGRDVALKVLPAHLVTEPAQRERLRREARAAAALNHPGICTVYALEEIGDDVVIASEFVDGQTLRTELAARSAPPAGAALLRTARELADALAAAHARGITHRDLKPENVMRLPDGRLKILDFGLALAPTADDGAPAPRVTTPGTLVGTPAYMAPEQLNGEPVDVRTDLFAFGVLMYEYATGVHPFDAPSALALIARVLEGQPRPLAELRPDVPPALAAAVERCLHKEPGARFASGSALASALDAAGRGDTDPVRSVVWWRTHMAIVMVLYLVAAVVGWFVKEWDHGYADTAFVVLGVLATVGGVLRGHLLFAEHAHAAAAFRGELARRTPILLAVDCAIGFTLVLDGVRHTRTGPVAGVLVIGLGVGLALARLVVERTTTDGAFGLDGRDAAETPRARR